MAKPISGQPAIVLPRPFPGTPGYLATPSIAWGGVGGGLLDRGAKSMERAHASIRKAKPALSVVGLLGLVLLYSPAPYLTLALT